MYLRDVDYRLSKHFLISSCIVYSFLTKRRNICSFKPTKAILRPTASPLITREDNLQVLEMIIIPCHGTLTLEVQGRPKQL